MWKCKDAIRCHFEPGDPAYCFVLWRKVCSALLDSAEWGFYTNVRN